MNSDAGMQSMDEERLKGRAHPELKDPVSESTSSQEQILSFSVKNLTSNVAITCFFSLTAKKRRHFYTIKNNNKMQSPYFES